MTDQERFIEMLGSFGFKQVDCIEDSFIFDEDELDEEPEFIGQYQVLPHDEGATILFGEAYQGIYFQSMRFNKAGRFVSSGVECD
jgi:hypothetical protein